MFSVQIFIISVYQPTSFSVWISCLLLSHFCMCVFFLLLCYTGNEADVLINYHQIKMFLSYRLNTSLIPKEWMDKRKQTIIKQNPPNIYSMKFNCVVIFFEWLFTWLFSRFFCFLPFEASVQSLSACF